MSDGRQRTVNLQVQVVPVTGNESEFWEPSDTLVAWGVAEMVFGVDRDSGWKVTSVRPLDEEQS
jgi:hypothetical protein